ncbi:MAG: T9SS type A sorting domain-containing protein [bacterium]
MRRITPCLLFIIGITFLFPLILCAQDFWQQTNGPFGGNVRGLAVHPNGDIYAGTETNGLLRSKDNGETWKRLTNGLPARNSFGFTLAINAKGHIFAGGWSSVYRSIDAGETWTNTNLGQTVYALAINSAGHIFAGTFGALYRSVDNGNTWSFVYRVPETFFYALAINSNNDVFASSVHISARQEGIYRSTDNGQTWVQTSLKNEYTRALIVDSQNTLFAGTVHGVYRTFDAGETWEQTSEGLPNWPVVDIYAFTIDSQGNIFVGGNIDGVYFSTNGGKHWTKALDSFGSPTASLAAGADGKVFAGILGHGIFRSIDHGKSWTQVGIVATEIRYLVEDPRGSILACAVDIPFLGGVFKFRQDQDTWELLMQNGYPFRSLVVHSNGDYFVGVSAGEAGYGRILRSTDLGISWFETSFQDNDAYTLIGLLNGEIWASTLKGVFRSSDLGQTWSQMGLSDFAVSALHIDAHGHLFGGTTGNGIWVSRDEGKTWSQTDFPSNYNGVNCITSDVGDRIFAGTVNGGIFRSLNDGTNWSKVGLDSVSVNAILLTTDKKVYLGANTKGVLVSSDYGDTWTTLNSGLFDLNVTSLLMTKKGYLYAGTLNNGVWRSTMPITSIQETNKRLSFDFLLEQNYPNPFNPSTTIQFSLSRLTYVTLKIYNTLGEEVTTLVAAKLSPGRHQVEWQAEKMAAGAYVYRLQAGDFIQTRKLILLK